MADRGTRTRPEQLGVLIKETQAVLHQRMDEVLRPLGLTVPQYVCLENLNRSPGITSSELARRTFVSRQSMNVLLQGLEKHGLVERSEDPGPRRERAAELTVAAQEVLVDARRRVEAVADRMTAVFDSDQLARLQASLAACRDALTD